MSAEFERVSSETRYEGRIVTVRADRFRYEDGSESDREIVAHQGAVAVVAHDDEQLYLVRQPREAVGVPDLLEIPAGKLDEEGEEPDDTARRELAEEIGKGADHWEHLTSFYTSPGFAAEGVHLYRATGLRDERAEAEENERIEVVRHPLDRLDEAIRECKDSKSLVGLLWLRAFVLG